MEEIDFYQELNVFPTSSNDEIINSYNKQINQLSEYKITDEIKYKIKILKAGLYILLNPELKIKYNKFLNFYKTKQKSKNNEYNEPNAINQETNYNLDSQFIIDNSWMNNIKTNNEYKKKNEQGINQISNRIFSMSEYKIPQFSSDFEEQIRKQQQGRPTE